MIMSVLQIAGLVLQGVGIAIFVPILAYYAEQFRRDSLFIKLKHKSKNMIYLLIIVALFGLIIERPFVIVCNTWHINKYLFNFPLWIVSAINSVYISLFFALNTIYLWLLFYYKHYHIEIAELRWKKQINPRYRSWYILNKQKWGNPSYIILILIIPFLIYIMIQLYIENAFYLLNIKTYPLSLISTIFTIPSFILYCKSKQFVSTDMFHCKKEIALQCIIIVIFITIYLSIFITEIVGFYYGLQVPPKTELLITEFTRSGILFLSSFITIYTAWKQTLQLIPTSLPNKLAMCINTTTIRNISTKCSTRNLGIPAMLELLANFQGFQLFMQHLVKEWSAENLLFVLELIEIKYNFEINHFNFDPTVGIPAVSPHSTTWSPTPNASREPSMSISTLDINDEADDADEQDVGIQHNMDKIGVPTKLTLQSIPSGVELEAVNHINNKREQSEEVNSGSIKKKHSYKKTSSVLFEKCISSYLHNIDGTIYCHIKLPSGLPKSEVLNMKKTFIEQLYEIYLKYIKSGAVHEINISYFQRKTIQDSFEKLMQNINENVIYDEQTEYGMFTIMDNACIEILNLLQHSYTRFLLTPQAENI